jgi:hypothetical protein
MTILNTVLFGVLAGLVSLKIVLLAAAAVLFVHGMTQRVAQRRAVPVPARVRPPRLDVHA